MLGSIAADKGDVFMYSLEDPLPRVQKRLAAMSEDADAEWPEALHVSRVASMIASQATPVKTGLLGELEELVSAYPATRLIIVDHLGVVMPEDEPGKRRYGLDLKVLHPLQQWAVERRVALMFLTHCRKPSTKGETDPLDEIIESTGRTAVADTVLVLQRTRGLEGEITLAVRSKDVDAEEIKLTFDAEHCRYASESGVGSILSEWMQPIYALLEGNPEGLEPKDVALKLKESQTTVRGQLKRMKDASLIEKQVDGRYVLKGTARYDVADFKAA